LRIADAIAFSAASASLKCSTGFIIGATVAEVYSFISLISYAPPNAAAR